MSKIEVVNTETGEHLLVEKVHYFKQLRKRGMYALVEEYNEPVVEEVVMNVVGEEPVVTKRGRGRPRKDS